MSATNSNTEDETVKYIIESTNNGTQKCKELVLPKTFLVFFSKDPLPRFEVDLLKSLLDETYNVPGFGTYKRNSYIKDVEDIADHFRFLIFYWHADEFGAARRARLEKIMSREKLMQIVREDDGEVGIDDENGLGR